MRTALLGQPAGFIRRRLIARRLIAGPTARSGMPNEIRELHHRRARGASKRSSLDMRTPCLLPIDIMSDIVYNSSHEQTSHSY
jgi:hypothetical protein